MPTGQAIAVSGTHVYVTGSIFNNNLNAYGALFGGSGTTPGTLAVNGASSNTYRGNNLLVAGYTDQGSTATLDWAQAAGGSTNDAGGGIALGSTMLYVTGITSTPSAFGSFTLASSSTSPVCFLGALDLPGTLATSSLATTNAPALHLYPNPTSTAAHLSGAAPHMPGQLLDALGRAIATFITDAAGAALLPAGLAPGVYAVRVGTAVGRWVVQ